MKNRITSLEALQQEKKKLRMEIELSKREFAHSLGSSRANLKNFMVTNVAIPAGIAGLGIAGANKLMHNSEKNRSAGISQHFLSTILPLLATVVQTYFFKNPADEHIN